MKMKTFGIQYLGSASFFLPIDLAYKKIRIVYKYRHPCLLEHAEYDGDF